METRFIFGRPNTGKTTRLLEELRGHEGKALFVSIERAAADFAKAGLGDGVVITDDSPLSAEAIVEQAVRAGATMVAIDYLELLRPEVDILRLQELLDARGVGRFVITATLRRDMSPSSRKRLEEIPGERIFLTGEEGDGQRGF
jgi:hypothetical protein